MNICYRLSKYMVLLIAFVCLPSAILAHASSDKKKLLVKKMTDDVREVIFSYDENNRPFQIEQVMKSTPKEMEVDKLNYDKDGKIIERVTTHQFADSKKNYTQTTVYVYKQEKVIIKNSYTNGEPASIDTIIINKYDQVIADKYFTYNYDSNRNGFTIVDQVVVPKGDFENPVNEVVKRIEYDSTIAPFINLNLPSWFIVNQLYLFEYVGDNAPKGIIHQTISKEGGEIKVLTSDLEHVHITRNADGYPTLIWGEDDTDGKWEVTFEYVEMK